MRKVECSGEGTVIFDCGGGWESSLTIVSSQVLSIVRTVTLMLQYHGYWAYSPPPGVLFIKTGIFL